MKAIIDGFLKFQQNAFPERVKLFKDLANQQSPKALFISCSDSRLVPELGQNLPFRFLKFRREPQGLCSLG